VNKIECPYCGEMKLVLIKMPVTVVKRTVVGEATYVREGYKSNGEADNICADCLEYEACEALN
jgi:hypothetical protein